MRRYRTAIVALAISLGACAGLQRQPANPATVERIKHECEASGFFKAADTTAAGLIPVPGVALAVELVNAGVDQVCADPERFASDEATVGWLIRNFAAAKAKPASP